MSQLLKICLQLQFDIDFSQSFLKFIFKFTYSRIFSFSCSYVNFDKRLDAYNF